MANSESWNRFKKRAEKFDLKAEVKQPVDIYPIIVNTLEISFLLLVSVLTVVLIHRIWSDSK